jgi:hypothetical protein
VNNFDRVWNAINSSVRLSKTGEHEKALEILDSAIGEAIKEGQTSSIVTMCHHAAILAGATEDISRVKHYYQQSLASDPDNPMALYGLADVALEQGETEIAKRYAIRCHAALIQSEDGVIKQGLLELLARCWPDVVVS